MKLKKHLAAVVVLVVAASLGASGCDASGADSSAPDGKAVIRIAVWDYKKTPEFKALIDGFEAKNPKIDVQPVDILAESYGDKVTTMLAGGDAPDVLTMKNVTVALSSSSGFWHRSWGPVAERHPGVRLRGVRFV